MQLAHAVVPAVDTYVPALQARQAALDAAPTVVENDPAAQPRHWVETEAPTVAEYVPALQLVQVADPAAVQLPGLHAVQVVLDDAPTALLNDPALQLRHTVETEAAVPTVDEYLPTTHALHAVEAAAAQNPAPQLAHAAKLVALAEAEKDPAGHDRQTTEVEAAVPIVDEYVPALQLVHAVALAAAQKPAPQLVHAAELVAPAEAE